LKTLPNAPTVVTEAASAVTQTSATLHATVNPNGSEVGECKFEYGTSTSYGSSAACTPAPGSGESAVAVSASVSGLAVNTGYHFRISASSSGGTSKGADQILTTLVGATAHYFSGGLTELSRIAAGENVPVISWGTLSLTNLTTGSKVECREVIGGFVQNPAPGGAEGPPGVGEIQSFNAYACESATCTPEVTKSGPVTYVSVSAETIGEPYPESGSATNLRWSSHLLIEGKVVRSESEHVKLNVTCHLNTGTNAGGEPEYASVLEEVSEGSQKPKLLTKCCKATSPAETEFDPGSGALHHPPPKEAEQGKTEGVLRTLGYNEEEVINAKEG
jgi:hypothetical protein